MSPLAPLKPPMPPVKDNKPPVGRSYPSAVNARPSFRMKYCVFRAKGVKLYALEIAGGYVPCTWPRQIQSPIEDIPLTGMVGALVAFPEGSVPPGKILP